MIDFATLTGAARGALGPDLPALFSASDPLAQALLSAGMDTCDPLWRLPLWAPYNAMIKSRVADLDNAPESPFAGAITAALFLQAFVPDATPWAHIDLFAWRPSQTCARPKGGCVQSLKGVYKVLANLARTGSFEA